MVLVLGKKIYVQKSFLIFFELEKRGLSHFISNIFKNLGAHFFGGGGGHPFYLVTHPPSFSNKIFLRSVFYYDGKVKNSKQDSCLRMIRENISEMLKVKISFFDRPFSGKRQRQIKKYQVIINSHDWAV